jgi:hypothetical protein
MKVDLELISAALNHVLLTHRVAPLGAIPLRDLLEHWEAIHLRNSDLSAGIEALHRQGRIELEPRRDGLWVRRRGTGETTAPDAYGKLRDAVRELVVGLNLEKVRRRRSDGYSGIDRRQGRGGGKSGPQAAAQAGHKQG